MICPKCEIWTSEPWCPTCEADFAWRAYQAKQKALFEEIEYIESAYWLHWDQHGDGISMDAPVDLERRLAEDA